MHRSILKTNVGIDRRAMSSTLLLLLLFLPLPADDDDDDDDVMPTVAATMNGGSSALSSSSVSFFFMLFSLSRGEKRLLFCSEEVKKQEWLLVSCRALKLFIYTYYRCARCSGASLFVPVIIPILLRAGFFFSCTLQFGAAVLRRASSSSSQRIHGEWLRLPPSFGLFTEIGVVLPLVLALEGASSFAFTMLLLLLGRGGGVRC